MIKQDIKLTTDAVVFSKEGGMLCILLIQRKNDPYKGHWALPGGFVEDDEDLEPAARRELEEETGLRAEKMTQLYTIGTPGRDPRGRTVSVVYYTFVDAKAHTIKGADDAAAADWFDVMALPPLAFDHLDIINYALATVNK